MGTAFNAKGTAPPRFSALGLRYSTDCSTSDAHVDVAAATASGSCLLNTPKDVRRSSPPDLGEQRAAGITRAGAVQAFACRRCLDGGDREAV
jgi:hypothetical protein